MLEKPGMAQVNTEKLRKESVDGFTGSIGSNFIIRAGNRELYILGTTLRLDYQSGKHETFAIGNGRFLQQSRDVILNSGFFHGRYNFRVRTWLSLEFFGQAEFDETRFLNERYLGGSGLRFRLFRNDQSSFYLGTTPMYEYEALSPKKVPGIDPNTTTYRWSNYIVARIEIDDRLSLVNTVYFQPQIDAPDDIRILDEGVFNVQITRFLALSISLSLRYDSRPPPGLETYDIELRNGLTVSF
jgi:hypothetical protein